METILNVLPVVSVIATVVTAIFMIPDAIRAIQELKNRKTEKPSFVSLRKSPTKNTVQYIAKRNWLILRAKQEAKKRPYTLHVNAVDSCCIIALSLTSVYAYKLLPWLKEAIDSSFYYTAFYGLLLLCLSLLLVLTALQLLFNVSTWMDMVKK